MYCIHVQIISKYFFTNSLSNTFYSRDVLSHLLLFHMLIVPSRVFAGNSVYLGEYPRDSSEGRPRAVYWAKALSHCPTQCYHPQPPCSPVCRYQVLLYYTDPFFTTDLGPISGWPYCPNPLSLSNVISDNSQILFQSFTFWVRIFSRLLPHTGILSHSGEQLQSSRAVLVSHFSPAPQQHTWWNQLWAKIKMSY